MAEDILTEEIRVDLEEIEGKVYIKRLADGSHPLDLFGRVLAEENEAYKAANQGLELYSWSQLDEKVPGKEDVQVLKLYRRNDAGDMEVYRKFVVVDNKTGTPLPKSKPNQKRLLARRDSVEQVGVIYDFEKTRAEMTRRGVNIVASSSWKAIEQLKGKLEG